MFEYEPVVTHRTQSSPSSEQLTIRFMSKLRTLVVAGGKSVSSLVCKACWNTLFAFDSFQTAWCAMEPLDGFLYSVTWKDLVNSVNKKCNWCKLLVEHIQEYVSFEGRKDPLDSRDMFKIRVRFVSSKPRSLVEKPVGRNTIDLEINDTYIQRYQVHAAPGTYKLLVIVPH